MPYIKERQHIDKHLDGLKTDIHNSGDLTYTLYKLCLLYIKIRGECYDRYATVVGCLDNTKQEIQRRCLNPYEDEKIEENGDVRLD